MTEKRRMHSIEAEAKSKDFIKQKHAGVEHIFFSKMHTEENAWVLQGEVEFKRAHFFATVRTVEAQVNINTGEVTSYKEEEKRSS